MHYNLYYNAVAQTKKHIQPVLPNLLISSDQHFKLTQVLFWNNTCSIQVTEKVLTKLEISDFRWFSEN